MSDGIQQWESPADGVSRLINERLRTDQFIVNVADLAGLTEFVETDPTATAIISESVWASSGGNSLLSVSSTWSDPQTSYELVTATIEAFQQYLADSVASNSSEAKAFYSERLVDYQKQATEAEKTLIDYRDALPELEPDESYQLADQLELERLSKALENADESVAGVLGLLEEAELAVSPIAQRSRPQPHPHRRTQGADGAGFDPDQAGHHGRYVHDPRHPDRPRRRVVDHGDRSIDHLVGRRARVRGRQHGRHGSAVDLRPYRRHRVTTMVATIPTGS